MVAGSSQLSRFSVYLVAGDFLLLTPVSVKLASIRLSDDQEGSRSTPRAYSAIVYINEDVMSARLALNQLDLVL